LFGGILISRLKNNFSWASSDGKASLPSARVIAHVLRKAEQNPNLSPTKLWSYASINYYSFKAIIEAVLLCVEEIKPGTHAVKLTAKERRFLEVYI